MAETLAEALAAEAEVDPLDGYGDDDFADRSDWDEERDPKPDPFADGQWIHVKFADGQIVDVIRPDDETWHNVVDLLLAALVFVRHIETRLVADLYHGWTEILKGEADKAARLTKMPKLWQELRRNMRNGIGRG